MLPCTILHSGVFSAERIVCPCFASPASSKMSLTTPLQDLLRPSVDQRGAKVAIRYGDRSIQYTELDRRIRQMASGLLQCKVSPGDRVAWMLSNSLDAVTVTLACYHIGAVAVPLNYRYLADETRYVLDQTRPTVFVFQGDRSDVAETALSQLDGITAFSVGAIENGLGIRSIEELYDEVALIHPIEVNEEDPALILYTSGSTGRPKGVVHSHRGVACAIDVSREVFDFSRDDIVLVGKPISHAGGLQTQLLPALMAGAEVILVMKPTPYEAAKLINQYAVSQYGLLASDLLDFVEYLEQHPIKLPSLRNSVGSGDSVPHDLHERFRKIFGWEVMEGAGMTEIGGYYAMNPRYGVRKWGSLGLPTPRTEIQIVNQQGKVADVGEDGEILVRAPSATIGYWQNPEASQELFGGGWLHTGDLARVDEDGYVWFVGRKKLMIVRRGSNIAPAEVENVIDEHPQVHSSVVVGVKDRRDGQVPIAFVAPLDSESPPSDRELRAFVSERLAAYKNPARYIFLDELPRTGTGKLDRHRLEQMASKA